MKKALLFAVVSALAAMALEPVGWFLAAKPVRWIHIETALVIGIAVFAYRRGMLVDHALAHHGAMQRSRCRRSNTYIFADCRPQRTRARLELA
jgi:hypothetical protein